MLAPCTWQAALRRRIIIIFVCNRLSLSAKHIDRISKSHTSVDHHWRNIGRSFLIWLRLRHSSISNALEPATGTRSCSTNTCYTRAGLVSQSQADRLITSPLNYLAARARATCFPLLTLVFHSCSLYAFALAAFPFLFSFLTS